MEIDHQIITQFQTSYEQELPSWEGINVAKDHLEVTPRVIGSKTSPHVIGHGIGDAAEHRQRRVTSGLELLQDPAGSHHVSGERASHCRAPSPPRRGEEGPARPHGRWRGCRHRGSSDGERE